jgi:hypothetical protein
MLCCDIPDIADPAAAAAGITQGGMCLLLFVCHEYM